MIFQGIFRWRETMSIFEIIQLAVFGLIVGVIARLPMALRDKMGLTMTSILGIVGCFLWTFLGRNLFGKGEYYQAKWLMSILGSLVLLILYRVLFARRE